MKGLLGFMILWMLRNEPKTGMELARELEERKGHRPSPGTIYPVLKVMTERGLLSVDGEKRYSLTVEGKGELDRSLDHFFSMFFDIDEMREACRCKGMGPGHRHPDGECPWEASPDRSE
jgi:DNA-binding PadR family transcriptional regulator